MTTRRPPMVRTGPSRDDAHEIKFFRRHVEDDPLEMAPGREFLRVCDPAVRMKLRATLAAVANAPPHRFAGGGFWEAMHGEMTGWYEARRAGRHRMQYRLFCLIDTAAIGAERPWLVVVAGLRKPAGTGFAPGDYRWVRALGEEYLARNPRSVV
ncbi:hypothetical protein [Actinoplanes sp. RD1]|uniref:hypothetical protein n=1 Tax=Actinoplanes sp. RD1 TaxID=3064538 RepID=UPI0027403C87|nr:hypothetical protein [Actinoplanes sp. RD1]